jgi:glycosyltransferase involved in cell wall biosynthesis
VKILHLLSYHLVTGPAEPVMTLIAAQRAAGHDSQLACDTVRDGDLVESAEQAGIPVDRRFALCAKSGPILLMRDVLAFKRLWRDDEVNVLHSHRSHDHTLAALARPRKTAVSLVRTLHAERSLAKKRDWQLRHADGLITIAQRHRRELQERGIMPPDRIVAVEGAVDCERFRPGEGGAEVRSQAGVPADAPVAGIVARMSPDRGHQLLLQAWSRVAGQMPGARLLIAGRGELEQELRLQVDQAGLGSSVTFIGYRRDLPRFYRALDLKVLLAPGNDGTCRAALEAMASGVPVLAAERGALGEIVRDGQTGRIVPADDPDALASAILQLLGDRQGLVEMGRRARADAESRFSIGRQAGEIEGLYRLVLGTGDPALPC